MNFTKKQRERRSLNAVLRHFGIAPTTIDETEEPDFLLRIHGAVIGAEVTELYQPSASGAHLQTQAVESEHRLMVEMARRRAIELDIPPQQVAVRLSSHVLTKQNRSRVSAILCEYVASHLAAPSQAMSSTPYDLPPEIVYIAIFGLRKTSTHQWDGPCSGWPNSEFADGFQAAIAKKDLLLPKYLERCKQCWLITVARSEGGSSFIEWSDQLACYEFSAKFERVFFVQGPNDHAFELQLVKQFADE
jgi:hypothetical protein